MRVFISTADVFGDVLGASIAACLECLHPQVELAGVGGERMEHRGVEIVGSFIDAAAIGLETVVGRSGSSILGNWRELGRRVRAVRDGVEEFCPDVLLMISSPGLNLALGQMLSAANVPSIYLLPPDVWAWSDVFGSHRRVAKVLNVANEVITGLEFEAEIYERYKQLFSLKTKIAWFGHPVADCPVSNAQKSELRARVGLKDSGDVIGVYPGSRWSEVEELLPTMLEACSKVAAWRRGVQFVLPVAGSHLEKGIRNLTAKWEGRLPLKILSTAECKLIDIYRTMACCRAAMVASGTVSLELLQNDVPSVICYALRMGLSTMAIASGLVQFRTGFLGLPNIVAGDEILPELVQEEFTADAVAKATLKLLEDGHAREEVLAGMRDVKEKLGRPGVLSRVAGEIMALAGDGAGRREGAEDPNVCSSYGLENEAA